MHSFLTFREIDVHFSVHRYSFSASQAFNSKTTAKLIDELFIKLMKESAEKKISLMQSQFEHAKLV